MLNERRLTGRRIETVDLPKRVLADKTVFSDEMTREACATACAGYSYFGVEYGSECYCSNVFDALASESRPEVECNVPCSGNASETCGAGMRLNVYHDPTATPIPATILDYTYEGCYEDSVASRILPDLIYHGHDMTLALCAEKCSAAGYEYFGVEFSQECFCGHELADGSAPAAGGDIECFMPCAGLGTQICGGPQRLTLYSKPAAQPPQPEPVAPNNIV